MCVRGNEREREVGKLIVLKIDWISVCVCERVNETERKRSSYCLVLDCGVAGYFVWYLRKCKMEKKIKEIQDLF